MQGINNKFVKVPLTFPGADVTGTTSSDIISLKNYNHVDLFITVGSAIGKAAAVTLNKSAAVAAATVSLPFTKFLSTGFILKYDSPSVSTIAAADETISGAGGGAGTIYKDTGTELICYGYNGTTFVDNETVTLSGGKTVVANGIQINEDIMVPRSTASATTYTFDLAAVANKQYCIPIDADMLGEDYDCVQVEIADCDTVTYLTIDAILTEPRYIGDIPETAIYD
jgi:hypothetical protein